MSATPTPRAATPPVRTPGTVVGMVNRHPLQATVATFDPASGGGSLLLDDGTPVAFPPEAFAASGLRLLRLGQRVRLERDNSGAVTLVTLLTLPSQS